MREVGLFLVGAVTGLFSVLFGTGGGVILGPLLISLYGMEVKTAAGTTLATIVPTALLGAYYHLRLGTVDLGRSALMALGSLLGLQMGYAAAQVLPELALRRLFGAFLLLVALRLIAGRG